MNSILVVCEGNICRSPMAQGLLGVALPGEKVLSAGIGALVGMPADDVAVKLLRERGIDISGHRAIQINRQMCLDSDVVLVMEEEQKKRLVDLYPQARGRVFLIGEHLKRDVPDPYRKSEKAFAEALSLIDAGIGHWLPRIKRL